ncbi:MAG: hypothetical protein JWP63_4684 [Candidatus Solibacter sp.]|jgi:hypothetical protein|nr:hypothetical protein [Candidatus Solibacter sp.]
MRKAILLWAAVALGSAQPQPDQKELNAMLDEIRAAVRTGDWPEASRVAIRLNGALLMLRSRTMATPSLELSHLEMLGGKDPMTRNPLLARMTKAAFAASDWVRAKRYADEALEAAKHGVFWWTGDAIHQGNLTLGRLALRDSDVEGAKRYLLAAGKTPGSGSLASLGPGMGLAKELLDRGETATVIEYLEECRNFWDGNRGKLPEWLALVKAGLRPDFGANLGY